ncbi:TPA: hypothetical protein VDA67_001896 [Burkholderia vietnamiensis]|nr:hypothetical protein [Burkholderia vietnamiensis]HEP6283564.1 hypothetical protein [Burkholderia vietnamiensis]HEP6309034.1 hypothetical protein [Burkholderia vietnamiensis]
MIKAIIDIFFPAIRLAKGLNVAAAVSAAGAVAGAAGSVISSQNQADAAASAAANANAPWSAAQPYISGEFKNAQDALHAAQGMGTYSGERVAGLNPYQTQGANQTAAWANGNGQNTANQFFNTGMGMTGAGSAYGTNAQNLLTSAQGANPMQSFIDAGSQLANSSTTQGMIDAANLSVSRDLNESALPTLAVNAAGAGNTDSTRTGVAQAILQSHAQQNMLANAQQIQGQMFNTGMSAAQNQFNANQQHALDANQQLGSAFQMGSSALLNGQQANGNNFDQLNAAGGLFQNQQQSQDQAAYQKFQEDQTTPLNLIGQYMNVINGKWGGPAVSSVGPSVAGGAIQGALGGGMMGAGLAGKLGGYGSSSYSPSAVSSGVGYSTPDLSPYYSGGGNVYGFTGGF